MLGTEEKKKRGGQDQTGKTWGLMLRTVKDDDIRDSGGRVKHMALKEYEVRGLEDEGGYQRTVTMLPGI